ncbi:nudC domain-containing protein 1 [Microcaecilia unicolor]|uniref:NudC domain-containing protein 1 n=1 Tax=Microcaecilia unicolor TaxID=1415580 RepID=A0A6P7ZEA7_9AMPH|nr:nudC domain-containing protein 1 [Microcaecilia unicolor]
MFNTKADDGQAHTVSQLNVVGMEAANRSLSVDRQLLDPKFESYRLSLDPLPCYKVELEAAVAEVNLRDDQYTLDHMRTFGMYNYLHCDSWYPDSVYYVDQLGRVMNLSVTLDTALGKPREVFRLPSDLTAYDDRLCASIHFPSSTWATLSDGTGRLYLLRTNTRGGSTTEKWEILFNQELGDPFIIVHSVSVVKSDVHTVEVILLRIEKDELDTRGSGFYVSLEWVSITTMQNDVEKCEISKHRMLHGKSVPHYVAIESGGDGLMIVSYKPFRFITDDGEELEEIKDGKKEPLYYWQQTDEDVTVTVQLPEATAPGDIQIQFSPNHISVRLKEQEPLLEGQLHSLIDHESSTWIMKNHASVEISLMKKDGYEWSELVVGDKQGEYVMSPEKCAAASECLIHLTSEDMNPDPNKEKPPCNAQELEECDIFLEDSTTLCRFDGNTLKPTDVVNLGSNPYLFSVVTSPEEMPCFCLRHDVDALLWQPHAGCEDNMWEHIATFNALGYVQASKQGKKFFTCAPNHSYAALCECMRRIFIYRQPTPVPTVLYNRKEGRQVGQVAKQQVASLETTTPILGFQATNQRLFVLTAKNLFLIKVNADHN